MVVSNRNLPFQGVYFQGAMLVSGRVEAKFSNILSCLFTYGVLSTIEWDLTNRPPK